MKILISLFLFSFTLSLSAQSYIQYSYDDTGNRIQRKLVLSLLGEGSEEVANRDASDSTLGLGVEEAATLLQQRTQVFPNPTQELLQVQFQEALPGGATIELFDMAGKRILRQPMPDTSTMLDIGSQQPGTYILIIRGKDFSARWKVVKQ